MLDFGDGGAVLCDLIIKLSHGIRLRRVGGKHGAVLKVIGKTLFQFRDPLLLPKHSCHHSRSKGLEPGQRLPT
jgi:hypothetical protein